MQVRGGRGLAGAWGLLCAAPQGLKRQRARTFPLRCFQVKHGSFVTVSESSEAPGRAGARWGGRLCGKGDGRRWGRDNAGIQQTGGNAERAGRREALNRPGCAGEE